jgi:hypothetical protein
VLGITRILGIFRRPVAFTSAALFALFAGAMTVSFGVKGAAQLFGFRVWKGRFSKHPGFRFGQLCRLKLYKKLIIRALQILRFLAWKMISQ